MAGWAITPRLSQLESLMNGRISCCALRKMRSHTRSASPAKVGGWVTFALKSKMKRGALVSQSCSNLLGTVWDEKCTRNRRFQLRQARQRPKVKSRHDAGN